jgi:hypothetical protein
MAACRANKEHITLTIYLLLYMEYHVLSVNRLYISRVLHIEFQVTEL